MNEERKETVDETKEDIGFDTRPSTVFYEQWYQTIKDFPPKEKEKAYKYIFEYAFYGIEPVKDKTTSMSYVVFSMAKPNIDSAKRRYDTAMENGQKGGRPKKVTEEVLEKIVELRKNGLTQKEVANELSLSLKTIQRVEKDISQNHNVNENDNVNENVNENSVASYEDNTELANARTVANAPRASLSASTMPTEIDFKCKLSCFTNESIKGIIDKKISECLLKDYTTEYIIDYLVKDFNGAFYQCDKEPVRQYVTMKLKAL